MFAAALIPGLIAVALFILTILVWGDDRPWRGTEGSAPGSRRVHRRDARHRAGGAGLRRRDRRGSTSASSIRRRRAAVGAVMVTLFGIVKGRLSRADGGEALLETARTTGMIYLILLGAELLKIFMARGGVPQAMAEWMAASGLTPTGDPAHPARGAHRAGLPDGQPVDDPADHPVLLAGAGGAQWRGLGRRRGLAVRR